MSDGASPSGVEELVRDWAPRVLGAVARRYRDFSAAEDAVQEALLAAHLEWSAGSTPANPGGWLYRVACRRMEDLRDSEEARRRREAAAGAREETELDSADIDVDAHDDTLALLFMCCHPSLTAPSAIALTLRAVGGLTTAEIARAFLVPEATMAQRISRAKQTIASAGATFSLPEAGERDERLVAVLHVLYLMFNEGYASTSGPELVRVELSTEAIRLARKLQRLEPDHTEAAGLLALMLLTDARRSARTGPSGGLIPLHEQDRSLWDRAAIAEGTAMITTTFARGDVGAYQVQAAIAALHDEAPSLAATDWRQIEALYGVLESLADNPLVSLNRAVAVAMVEGPAKGLELLAELEASGRLADNHRLEAVRAHLCELSGDRATAIRLYRESAKRTNSVAERNYLLTKAARLAES